MPPGAVAVVAVHGVADQQPDQSVRSIGDLLLRLRRDGAALYQGFRETRMRLPLSPVRLGPASGRTEPVVGSRRGSRGTNERPGYVVERLGGGAPVGTAAGREKRETVGTAPPSPPPHHQFSRALLERFEGSRGAYETLRLEGKRDGGREVHVYELYWADLSRVGRGLVGILSTFFQLVLHVPHLGRVAVDHALFEYGESGLWRVFARLHAWAVRAVTLFLPAFVLLMVLTLLTLLPGSIQPPWKLVAGVAVIAVALIVGYGVLLYRARRPSQLPRLLWGLLPLLSVVGAAGLGWAVVALPVLKGDPLLTDEQLAALIWTVGATAGAIVLLSLYDRQRPGARRWGEILAIALFLVPLLGAILVDGSRAGIANGVLWVYEIQLAGAGVVTTAFYLLALASAVCGLLVLLRSKGSARRRTARVVWTALASLALATAGFYLVTLVLGIGILFAGRSLLPAVGHPPLFPWTEFFFEAAGADYAPDLPEALTLLLRLGATSGLVILVAATLVVILLAAWGLGPAVWSEVRPPRGAGAAEPRRSEALGRWLDLAYPAFGLALLGLFIGVFALAPAASVLRSVSVARGIAPWTDVLWKASGGLLVGAGSLIAASAVGLLALRGRLEQLALGFRPVIDIGLDVDSYMRDLPAENTPRARMFERYVSLLRFLAGWRDGLDRPYEKIVIVAHSQGSVLSTDLLDFVQRESDPELPWTVGVSGEQGPRLYLFTMGSPLRQLYARCFPHLYWWIAGEPWAAPAGRGDGEPAPADSWGHEVGHELKGSPPPDPESLGLARWVNAYRTGDYVGRMLWRQPGLLSPIYRATAENAGGSVRYTVSEDASRRRRELCLGAGAHTHYWDETAEAIAEELDLLIG